MPGYFTERPDLCGDGYRQREERRRFAEQKPAPQGFDALVLAEARRRGLNKPGPRSSEAQRAAWQDLCEFVAAGMKDETP